MWFAPNMDIYTLWWCVCVSVTKNHHFPLPSWASEAQSEPPARPCLAPWSWWWWWWWWRCQNCKTGIVTTAAGKLWGGALLSKPPRILIPTWILVITWSSLFCHFGHFGHFGHWEFFEKSRPTKFETSELDLNLKTVCHLLDNYPFHPSHQSFCWKSRKAKKENKIKEIPV